LEDDLMKAPEEKLFDIKVLYTYLNGEQVYKR
jgi:predicted amidohydrolase YtcJ